MSDKKERNVFYVTHSMELLFWLILILLIVIFLFIANIKTSKMDNRYSIYMPDIDGLIVGSSVRAMGVDVGHITKIKPAGNDEVLVKFIITDKNITIPQGTVATVEFSGMAGSKSLELYLPDENTYIDKTVPILTVSPPKRLHDAAGLLNDMFKRIGDIIYTSSDFGHKLNQIELPKYKKSDQNPKEFLKYTDEVLDRSKERADNLRRNIENVRKK